MNLLGGKDTTGPIKDNYKALFWGFFFYIIIVSYIMLSLFVSIFYENFRESLNH